MKYMLLTVGWHSDCGVIRTWRQRDLADSVDEASVMMKDITGKFLKAVRHVNMPATDKVGEIGFEVWAVSDNALSPELAQGELPW